MQATSLGLLVVAGQIGVAPHPIGPSNYGALVAAGRVSGLVFPLVAVSLLR